MLNDVIKAISIKLNLEFGDTYTIYSEEVTQGLTEPCFIILSLNPTQSQVIGKRYFRQQPFDIHYFPNTQDKNEEMNDVADKLYNILEYVTIPPADAEEPPDEEISEEPGEPEEPVVPVEPEKDELRGTGLNHQIVDGVLHFFVSYNFYVHKKPETVDDMEELTVNNQVEEG